MHRDAEMLVRDVQRLTSEVERLRARVDAFERSRWWRLHPRFFLRRSPREDNEPGPTGEIPSPPTSPSEHDHLETRFRAEVLEKGAFTHHWFMHQIVPWELLLRELDGRSARLLEIGSFEGLSTCYLLRRLRDARVTCIDTFAGSVEYAVEEIDLSTLEEVFRRNVRLVDASRVEVIVDDSRKGLLGLVAESRRLDLVFVDGSHIASDVLVDAALSWQVLEDGGVFDDYRWEMIGTDPLLRSGPAIDAFLELVKGKYELLRRDVQLAVRKTG